MALFCARCGRPNQDSAPFCVHCRKPPRPNSPEHGQSPESLFVGRQVELEFLHEKLTEVLRADSGTLVALVGEAGIGKTWITQEFANRCRQRGLTVLKGSCPEGDFAQPFGPWVEAIDGFAASVDPSVLRRILGSTAGIVGQLIPQVRSVLPDTPVPERLALSDERFRLFDAVVQFLVGTARENPVLLVLDDLHWADRDTLHLLLHVVRFLGKAPVLVIGVYRQPDISLARHEFLPEVLAAFRREAGIQHLILHGLTEDEVSEYLAQASGGNPDPRLVKTIYAETDGNPFYVREILRHLSVRSRFLDGMTPPPEVMFSELIVPDGVDEVVRHLVSRLTPNTKKMLTRASAFASGFQFQVLRSLTDLPELTLLDCLDEAIDAGLIRSIDGRLPTYDFSHAIIRHAIYLGLNSDRRARLHRQVALVLRKAYEGQESEHAHELATQYHASVSLPGASDGVPFALAAADRARAAAAVDRAAHFLEMAYDLSAEVSPAFRAKILCRLAIAYSEALMLEKAERTAQEAIAALEESGIKKTARADFLARAALALREAGASPSMWEPLVLRGLELVGERRNLVWARLTLLLDRFEPVRGSIINAAIWQGQDLQAVQIARSIGDEYDFGRTLVPLDFRTREETEEVLALASSWRAPSAIMRALGVGIQDLFYRHGDFSEAERRLRQLLAVSERHGVLTVQAEALAELAMTLTILGELEEAQHIAQKSYLLIGSLGASHGLRFTQAALSSVLTYYTGGDWGRLAEPLRAFATSVEVPHAPYPVIRAGLTAAAIAAAASNYTGRPDEARWLLDALTPVAAGMSPLTFGYNSVLSIASVTVLELRAVHLSEAFRRMAVAQIEAGVGVSAMGPAELTIARMAVLQGRWDEAGEYYTRARQILDEKRMAPLLAVVDYEECRGLLDTGQGDRRRLLHLIDRSLAGFARLGMVSWATRARELRQRILGLSDMPKRNGRAPDRLTSRELQIAGLVAMGMTDEEIASELVISPRTAETHISHILGKLRVRRRMQIALWVEEREREAKGEPVA